jgi:hypothetical protein
LRGNLTYLHNRRKVTTSCAGKDVRWSLACCAREPQNAQYGDHNRCDGHAANHLIQIHDLLLRGLNTLICTKPRAPWLCKKWKSRPKRLLRGGLATAALRARRYGWQKRDNHECDKGDDEQNGCRVARFLWCHRCNLLGTALHDETAAGPGGSPTRCAHAAASSRSNPRSPVYTVAVDTCDGCGPRCIRYRIMTFTPARRGRAARGCRACGDRGHPYDL